MDEETVIEEAVAEAVEQRNGSGPGFILGLLVGGIAGAVVARLLAPSNGGEAQPGSPEAASPFGSAQAGPVGQVRAVFAGLRARVREAAEEGRVAAKEAEEKSRARYAELTRRSPGD